MPPASMVQTSFLGGEWSKQAQGQFDYKGGRYKTAMALCKNAYPIEEASCPRRPGFRQVGTTYRGRFARLRPFAVPDQQPYLVEFTDERLRFWHGPELTSNNYGLAVTNVTTADPMVFTISADIGPGFEIMFKADDEATTLAAAALLNRVFLTDNTTQDSEFILIDPVTDAPVTGQLITWSSDLLLSIVVVQSLDTPYTFEDWYNVRMVQSQRFIGNRNVISALLLHTAYQPMELRLVDLPPEPEFAQFAIEEATFTDGPYLDQIKGTTLTPAATSGNVNITLAFAAYDSAYSYSEGEFVTSSGIGYRSLQGANIAHTPASSATFWEPANVSDAIGQDGFTDADIGRHIRMQSGSTWVWGKIVAMTDAGFVPGDISGSANIGNMVSFGGLAAAFDGDNTKAMVASAGVNMPSSSAVVSAYVGKDYSGISGGGQAISSVVVTPPAEGFMRFTEASVVFLSFKINLYGKMGAAPANSSDGTLLGTTGDIPGGGLFQPYTISSSDQATLWDHVWVQCQGAATTGGVGSGARQLGAALVQFYSNTGASGTGITVQLVTGPLADTTTITVWRLGRYSDTTGWPTCGCYHEGRLWLAGVAGNHFDASVSNDPYNFSPTEADGSVTGRSAINYTFNSAEVNTIYWMKPAAEGILMGTSGGEWLVQASNQNNALTADNIQGHQHTGYKCANIEPVDTGMTTMFVQLYGRRLHEYLSDAYTGKFFAPNMSAFARHLTTTGVVEIAYQEEKTPIVWVLTEAGLRGMTYRRISRFSSEDPIFFAWHRHEHGVGRDIMSICVGPSIEQGLDTLYAVTRADGLHYVELATSLLDEEAPIGLSFFVDGGIVPPAAETVGSATRFYGLHTYVNRVVDVFACGLDCGSLVVAPGGYVDVPHTVLTNARMQDTTTDGEDYGFMTVSVDAGMLRIPVAIGCAFTTQAQLVRPMSAQDTGAQLGPFAGFARTKRGNEIGVLLNQAVDGALSVGYAFNKLRPVPLRNKKNQPVVGLVDGIYWGQIEGDYDMDGQICWQISRPYPTTVCAIGAGLSTQG